MKLQINFNILNMKKLILSASAMALLGAGALTSCSQEDVTQPNIVKSNEIGLSVAGIQTRATSDPQATSLAKGNVVGAFNTAEVGPQRTHGKYVAGDDKKLTAEIALMGQPNETVNVVAYAPYNSTWKYGENEFTVAENQSEADGYFASDLVYAGPTNAVVGQSTPLSFTHKLAQLKIEFVKKPKDKTDLSESTVKVTNVVTNYKIDLTNGEVTPATLAKTGDIIALTDTDLPQDAYAILVPQDIDADTEFVTITLKDGKTLTAKVTSPVNIQGGKSYKFTVTVGYDDIQLDFKGEDTEIKNWTGGQNIEGGQIDDKQEENQPAQKVNLTFSVNTATATKGEDFTEPVLTVSESGAEQFVKYTSSDTDVADVNESTGEVELKKYGTTKITASLEGTDDYTATAVSYTLIVREIYKVDLPGNGSGNNYSWDQTSAKYTWWTGTNPGGNVITLWSEIVEEQFKTMWFTLSELNLGTPENQGLRIWDPNGTPNKCPIYDASTNLPFGNTDLINKEGTYYVIVRDDWYTNQSTTIQFGGPNSVQTAQETPASVILSDVYFSTENPLEQ